jgi:tetrahydromethanopterin S-methyltransferase subunit G
MTEENKVPTIVVDDKEYEIASLSNEQKYTVSQLRDILNKLNDLSFQLDQLKAAQRVFSAALTESLKPEEESEE